LCWGEHNAPSIAPDIDLRPMARWRRRVAAPVMLARDQDTIVVSDLGSANHTF
jgi:hypothetical protein